MYVEMVGLSWYTEGRYSNEASQRKARMEKNSCTEVELILLHANRSVPEYMEGGAFSIFKSIRL